jgi:hypothetical protein
VQHEIDISEFARSIGLARREGDLFYGKRLGFAVGFKVINPHESPLLLFQVRYPHKAESPEVKAVRLGEAVERMRAAKTLELDFDDKLAWITLVDGGTCLLEGSVPTLVDGVLESFRAAGLVRDALVCFYCQRSVVDEPPCINDQVAVICPACLAERLEAPENRPAEVGEGLIPMGIFAPLAAGAGAAGWAGFWICYFLVLERLAEGGTLYIPHVVDAAAMGLVAFLTGGPVGFVIRAVRRRGRKVSAAMSLICSAGAVVMGEIAFITWFIYREIQVVSVQAAWELLPQLELALGGFHLMLKLVGACIAVAIAVSLARPAKAKIKL